LKVTLAEMPGVLRRIVEIETYDDEILNKAEDRLLQIATVNTEAAKRFYGINYLPLREHETQLILALRHEIKQVKEAVKVEAAETHAMQLVLGLSATAVMLILSGFLAWFSGRLAAGDTTIEIPAQGSKDEIGDMAKAVDVFRQNMIHADRLAGERSIIEQQLIQAQKMEAIGIAVPSQRLHNMQQAASAGFHELP
jgi:hypothetical protein